MLYFYGRRREGKWGEQQFGAKKMRGRSDLAFKIERKKCF